MEDHVFISPSCWHPRLDGRRHEAGRPHADLLRLNLDAGVMKPVDPTPVFSASTFMPGVMADLALEVGVPAVTAQGRLQRMTMILTRESSTEDACPICGATLGVVNGPTRRRIVLCDAGRVPLALP